MKDKNLSIKTRYSKTRLKDEYSFIDYHIVASREIIQRIDDMLHGIENKYPKKWEKKEVKIK